ncbi:MAG: PhoX family phosphatase [Rhodospirillales bacterium]|nr:PhoX family phosphatase [Rhodospirillales bacterium]
MSERFDISDDERRAIDSDLAAAESRQGTGQYIEDVMRERMQRRSFLKATGAVGAAAVAATFAPGLFARQTAIAGSAPAYGNRLQFQPILATAEDQIKVPDGYQWDLVLSWGDPLLPGAPAFDFTNQTAAAQAQQFGFNCDYIGHFVLPPQVREAVASNGALDSSVGEWLQHRYAHFSSKPGRCLLVVNHEYTSGSEMFPGYDASAPSEQQVLVEIEAHGCSVVELTGTHAGGQRFVHDSPFNRRITGTTGIAIGGPLRGDPRMRTSYSPEGKWVKGMFNNCSGGKTPWGTVLTCEENFDQYFANFGALPADSDAYKVSARIPATTGASERKWENFVERFDLAKEPNEYARFGYIVEIDPYDPTFRPIKRTALGRFKHEAANTAVGKNGRVAVYSGDDTRFEYMYKFITSGTFEPTDRAHNLKLLNYGTLYVAKFNADGTGAWLPLTADNPALAGWTLNDILINTRGAGDLVGATKMDRPEDVDVNPVTGKVYAALTNNTKRTTVASDAGEVAANPRTPNPYGHIIELIEDDDNAESTTFTWDIFILCGNPKDATQGTFFAGFDQSQVSPIACPDNVAFDDDGNLWIATDGMINSPDFEDTTLGVGTSGNHINDGVFAVPTEGSDRGWLRQFLSGIPGGEICGPEFSGDNAHFYCGIQHPGEGGGLPNTISAWPTGNDPTKPSVIVVYTEDHKKIGA